MTEETKTQSTEQSLAFKTEVQQLLNILANSLYTDREIFLRELLSNASDALHRIQFEMLTNREVADPDAELAIHVNFDKEAGTLTVSDSGIGMTRDELVENLGTIAHSGAMDFLRRLEEGQRPADIIGQFGVGFYSVFMVAEEVNVTSRSFHPDAQSWAWTSRGESTYTLTPVEKEKRGTTVTLKLKEDATEFASDWRLKKIVKKHSNYISFPIYVEDEVANQQTALWRQPAVEIEEEAYDDFYRQLTLDSKKPLLHVHLVSDVPVHIRSILYVPAHLDLGPLRSPTDSGLRLYSKKILIQENNTDLLPNYLRFVEGVVDSEDLPLNISRETVQSTRVMRQIERSLTTRMIKAFSELAAEHPDDYVQFWGDFGVFLKQGIATDPFIYDDLLPLLRFYSSKSGDELISLETYAARMQEEQPAIYYILGEDLESVKRSPHLDYFRQHDVEVLYLVDPLDGLTMQSLREFEGKPFQSVESADLEVPEEKESEEREMTLPQDEFDALVGRFKAILGDRIKEIRESKVLRDSPCRLVSTGGGAERDLQRVRRLLGEKYEIPPRILEINRGHPLIGQLARMVKKGASPGVVEAAIEQLFANQLLLEGTLPNPAEMVPRIQTLLEAATLSDED